MLVGPITHVHEILCSIPRAECKLDEHTLPRTVDDLIEVMILSIPATRSIRNIRQDFTHGTGGKPGVSAIAFR